MSWERIRFLEFIGFFCRETALEGRRRDWIVTFAKASTA